PHTMRGVVRELFLAIEPLGRGRQDLADPIRHDREVGGRWELGHPLDAPAGEVGRDRLLVVELELGLVQDPPASRTTTTALERTTELDAERRGCVRVAR